MRFTTKAMALVGAIATSAAVAGAQNVQYSTSGVFTGGSCTGTASCTVGGATLSFTGSGAQSVFAPVFGSSLGTFSLGASQGGPFSFNGISFMLTVTQTVPNAGTSMPVGTLLGSFSQTGEGPSGGPLTLSFANPNFSIGLANYSIVQPGGAINIRLPGGQGQAQTTDLQANINVIPEPSTYALMGTGLAALVGMASRRRRQVA